MDLIDAAFPFPPVPRDVVHVRKCNLALFSHCPRALSNEAKLAFMSPSVGDFRAELAELRRLRTSVWTDARAQTVPQSCHEGERGVESETVSPLATDNESPVALDSVPRRLKRRIDMSLVLSPAASSIKMPSSAPIIDQDIRIIRPTSWIDCISRESRRIFVHDYWIVARIILPPTGGTERGLNVLLK